MLISGIELFRQLTLTKNQWEEKLPLIFIAFFLVLEETFGLVRHTIVQASQNHSA